MPLNCLFYILINWIKKTEGNKGRINERMKERKHKESKKTKKQTKNGNKERNKNERT